MFSDNGVESSPDDSRGFLSSFLEFGTLGGYTLGAGIVTLMTVLLSDQAMHDWGWRVPFLCAAPLGLVGLYLRLKMEDSAAFTSASEKGVKSCGLGRRSNISNLFESLH